MGIKNLDGKISGKLSNKTPTIKGNLVNRVPAISGGLTTMPTGIDYNKIINHPSIEGNELIGDKTFKQLGLDTLTVQEVQSILYNNDKRRKKNG